MAHVFVTVRWVLGEGEIDIVEVFDLRIRNARSIVCD